MRQIHAPSPSTIASAAVLVALCSAVAVASEFPYYGVVTTESVDVQAGAGKNYYKAGILRRGDLAEVHNHFHQWFKIAPPPGVFSYVKTAFVVRSGDGATGTVTRDGVIVKTASLDGPPGLSYRQQRFLREGEQVFIIDEVGDFLKIRPPKGAFVFLAPGSIVPATAEQIAQAGRQDQLLPAASVPATPLVDRTAAATAVPAVDPVRGAQAPKAPVPVASVAAKHEPAVSEPTPPLPAPTLEAIDAVAHAVPVAPAEPVQPKRERAVPAVDPVTRVSRAPTVTSQITIEPPSPLVVLAERKLQLASLHPLQKQPIDKLLQAYEDLSREESLSPSDRQLVRARMLQLAQRQHLASTLKDVSTFLRNHRRDSGGESALRESGRPPHYAAVGQLVSSLVYDGQTLPMMYRVVEPSSFRTLAYVRPGTDGHAARCLGKLVGVIGEPRFDDSFKALVVDAVRVDLLEPVNQTRTTHAGRCLFGSMNSREI